MEFIKNLDSTQKCMIGFILIGLIISIVLKTKAENFYYSPLYTGIGLNKAFAIRSEEVVVDGENVKKLVNQIQEKEMQNFKNSPEEIGLINNPIIINEMDNHQTHPSFKRPTKYKGMFIQHETKMGNLIENN